MSVLKHATNYKVPYSPRIIPPDRIIEKRRRDSQQRIETVDKATLIALWDGRCAYCGAEIKNDRRTHIDHMIPLDRYRKIKSKFPLKYSTVSPCCAGCNIDKGPLTPLEYFWLKK